MATPITTSTDSAALSTADIIIIFVPQVDAPACSGAVKAVDEALAGAISDLAADGEINGKRGTVTVIHTLGKLPAKRVLIAGLGKPETLSLDNLRDAAAGAARRL